MLGDGLSERRFRPPGSSDPSLAPVLPWRPLGEEARRGAGRRGGAGISVLSRLKGSVESSGKGAGASPRGVRRVPRLGKNDQLRTGTD